MFVALKLRVMVFIKHCRPKVADGHVDSCLRPRLTELDAFLHYTTRNET